MISIAQATLSHYFTKFLAPSVGEILIDEATQAKRGCCFVTLYKNGQVRGSAGNIKEIEKNLGEEIVKNTMQALVGDTRFGRVTGEEKGMISLRLDIITQRKVIDQKTLKTLDPVKFWVIAIRRDYEKLAVILPNISAGLLSGEDFIPVLENKLTGEKFDEKNYIIYQIETEQETDY